MISLYNKNKISFIFAFTFNISLPMQAKTKENTYEIMKKPDFQGQ